MNPDFNLVFDMIKKIGHIIEDPNESFPWPSMLVFLDTLRTQRVAIVCSEKKYFGISKVVLLGIAYAGPEDVDPSIIRECLALSSLASLNGQESGDWSYIRLENGTNLFGYGIIVPVTDKLILDDLAKAIIDIAETADRGEQMISGDQDNF